MPHVELPQAEFKVVILGDTNTGKTSLVLRFVEGNYRHESRSATVGAFFLTKRITVDSITCKMLLWDTAGQQQFQKLAKTYYGNAAAAILAYDVTQPDSLRKLRYWLEELQRNTIGRRIVIVVAACKCDLEAAPGLEEEARHVAQSCGALYIETSAKDNMGVHKLFSDAAARVLQCQTEAATGTGPPIPVIVAGSGNGVSHSSATGIAVHRHRGSPKKTSHANANTNTAALDSAIRPEPTLDSAHHAAATTDPEADNNDTVVEGDDESAAKKQQTSSNMNNVICEGGLMVCGGDKESCCIM